MDLSRCEIALSIGLLFIHPWTLLKRFVILMCLLLVMWWWCSLPQSVRVYALRCPCAIPAHELRNFSTAQWHTLPNGSLQNKLDLMAQIFETITIILTGGGTVFRKRLHFKIIFVLLLRRMIIKVICPSTRCFTNVVRKIWKVHSRYLMEIISIEAYDISCNNALWAKTTKSSNEGRGWLVLHMRNMIP